MQRLNIRYIQALCFCLYDDKTSDNKLTVQIRGMRRIKVKTTKETITAFHRVCHKGYCHVTAEEFGSKRSS